MRNGQKRPADAAPAVLLLVSTAISVLIGSFAALGYLWIGFQENNQGEYFNPLTGKIDYHYVLVIFMAIAIPVSIVALILLCVFYRVAQR